MNTSFLTSSAALALATLALAAPGALARPAVDVDVRADAITTSEQQNLRGADAQGAPTGPSSRVRERAQMLNGADAQGAPTGPSSHVRERAQMLNGADAQGAPTDAPEVMVVRSAGPAPAPADHSVDWRDAVIGAGAVVGLSLLGLGAVLLVVHHRRRPLSV